jgi:hypothetical protein
LYSPPGMGEIEKNLGSQKKLFCSDLVLNHVDFIIRCKNC